MTKKDDIGYVYIFTNESFRDGWIKIGKTINIKKRLTDLDNTSCPMPFDVYATLKTRRYEEAETFVHEYISHFNSSLRVRPNREYFKVFPIEALEILYQVKRIMNEPGSEIRVYTDKDKKVIEQLQKKYGTTELHDHEEKIVQTNINHDESKPRLYSMKTLINYWRNLHSELTQSIMKEEGLGCDISTVNDYHQLEQLRDAIKVVEKRENIHHTHSCALSRYMDYISNGMGYRDMEHDVMILKGENIAKEKAEAKGDNKEKNRTKRRPPYKHFMAGLKGGEQLTFLPTGAKVKAVGENLIEYDGVTSTLNDYCNKFMPKDKQIPAGTYQGPKYFSYQGKTLWKIRLEKEDKEENK